MGKDRRVRKAGARDRERPRERERKRQTQGKERDGRERERTRTQQRKRLHGEGAAMIRTKGEAGTGNVVEAVRHCRAVQGAIKKIKSRDEDELFVLAKEMRVPYDLVVKTKELGRLPVVNFAAGGVATPADAALMMQLGVDGVFVGSGIFKSGDPVRRAKAIVE